LPLAKKQTGNRCMATQIKKDLQPAMRAVYDDTGGIGKLYARQDESARRFA
jgi:glycyl-tRNA synthetase (class II)